MMDTTETWQLTGRICFMFNTHLVTGCDGVWVQVPAGLVLLTRIVVLRQLRA